MVLLIIGVDPGTTLGYAILNDKGEFISSGSGKNVTMSELINNIIYFGKPLIIGCDKNPAPSFNEKLSAKLGAKLFHPKKDLLVKEKKELITKYDAKLNAHEQDALASAVLAFEKHKVFLEKINRFLKKQRREDLEEDVKLIMIRNEELPLQAALKIALNKYEVKKSKGGTGARSGRIKGEKRRIGERQLKELESRILVLEERNKKLRKILEDKNKLIGKLRRRLRLIPREELIDYKETRIKHYAKQLKEATRRLRHYEKEIRRRDEFIASLSRGVLVKKLDDLSQDEFINKKFLNISKDDILLVSNPASVSKSVISTLQGKVKIIITKRIPRSKASGFIFIKPDNVIIKESTFFAIADKNAIEEALKKKDVLKSIIEEYKKKRVQSTI